MIVNQAVQGISRESVTWSVCSACELPVGRGADRVAGYGARSAVNDVPYWAVQRSSRRAVRDVVDTTTYDAVARGWG